MMEWLKTILENVEVKDGKLDVDAVMKTVSTEFPKHAVPKTDFNAKVDELKAANTTIADLKKENASNEELQAKITNYETEIAGLKESELNTKKEYALKDRLKEAGVTDPDYIIYKQGGLDKFTFDKEGAPIGVDDVLKPMKETMPHMFKTSGGNGGYKPNGGGAPDGTNPFAKDTWNLTEQGKLLTENPTLANELASVAGIKL